MDKKKILVTYNIFNSAFHEIKARYEVIFPINKKQFTYNEVFDQIEEIDALCSMFDFPVDKAIIDKAKKLKLIANYAVGYDNIDVAYALEKGITVANTPHPVTAPTANLAFGLILDTARRITEYDRKLRLQPEKVVKLIDCNLGVPVTGKVLGIIGMGRIGKEIAKRAIAFGMEVIYHNRRQLCLDDETTYDATYVSLEELIRTADFISLNAPSTTDTFHLINEETLRWMKPTAIIINTSRGNLIDEKALIAALKDGTIRAAGLDVYEFGEQPSPELLAMDNVVLTPHVGSQTKEARVEMIRAVANNVIGYFENDRPIHRVVRV